MSDSVPILCRELSLLQFNRRVLAQTLDTRVPLLERLKFLCIVSSNLDEFFEVRMAWLKREHALHPEFPLANGTTPLQTIRRVTQEVRQIVEEQYRIFNEVLVPALKKEGIAFYQRAQLSKEQTAWINDYFQSELLPILTPIGLDPSHPFPRLLNKSLNFAVELQGKDAFGRPSGMAIVQAPRILPRVVKLPESLCGGGHGFVFLSSILHASVQQLFNGMEVLGCHQFRLTRDSELTVDEDDLKNLRAAIQGELHDRQYGDGVRLEVAATCPEHVSRFLLSQFQLSDEALYRVNGPVNLVRLMAVPDMVDRPDLKYPPQRPSIPKNISKYNNIFEAIASERDILLHHPYQSFQPVLDFIQEASLDPAVIAIKMTIYRTGSQSDLIKALIAAAYSGKQVTVVMELMARFDEEANVNLAARLEAAGAHVVYGVFGYKVHAKMALVVRRENGALKRYAHLGTGNYHQGTSRLYTDFGLLTTNEDMTADVNTLFMEITGLGQPGTLKCIYQSPFALHHMIMQGIAAETANARAGKPAKIMAKMNSLVEPQVIAALYEASRAGVEIDLIVRGMCALKPQIKGLSENIRVRSIIGRLLEHSRIYYFLADGAEKVYISSADWMGRNFFSRIETCTPVLNAKLKKRVIREGFTLALADNAQAWLMRGDGTYERVAPAASDAERVSLQEALLDEYQR